MTTLQRDTAAQPANHREPRYSDYASAVTRFLESGSEANREEASQLAQEIAGRRTPLRDAFRTLWGFARPVLESRKENGLLGTVDSIVEMEQDLCAAFEKAGRLDRQSHERLASAYSYKIREVSALLDSLPAFVVTKESSLRYTSANRPFCEALGLEAEEVISKNDADLFARDAADRLIEQDQQVIQSGSPMRSEFALEFKGRSRTVLMVKAPILDSNGNVDGLIGVGFDVTERKQIEKERMLLAAALESAGEAIFITDARGTIQYVNPAFSTITGYSREDVIGEKARILKSGREDDSVFTQMWDRLKRGEVWQGTLTARKKGGAVIDVDETIAPVRDSLGQPTNYVAVMRDITERVRMVETLRQAVMVKTDFTSMVSHELRTPLTAIKEAIDIVEDQTAGPINEQQLSFLALAKRNIDRLHRLINDTLDFSKLERGGFRLRLGRHDLNAVTREVVMQQQPAAAKQGLWLELSTDDGLEALTMDPDRISQVLVNLIGNAIRYCQEGWIKVSTRREGDEAVVQIEDSGPGIPADQLDDIFEAFVQLSTGPGRRAGGTGLGLAICKQIIEMHGGRIWVESEVGRGSKLYFALRLKEQENGESEGGHCGKDEDSSG